VVWLLLFSPFLAVESVQVTGTGRLTVAQVQAAVGVRAGTPLARVDTAAVAARVRALPPVASVTISRGWPHVLRVVIVERVALVAVRRDGAYQLLDATGADIASTSTIPRGVVLLEAPAGDARRAALDVVRALPAALSAQLASVRAPTPEQVTLLLKDHRQVLWGGNADNGVKVSALLALLKMPGTVFDVSAPGVVTRR
jgi:cell division protein FtsQ